MLSCLKQPKGFYKRLLYLSLPVIAQNLITTSLGFMDTFMVGLLGSDQMSAVTVANVPIFIIQLVVFGLQSGSSILISQYWGKGDRESVNRVIGIGFYIAGGISTLFALILFFFPAGVLGLITDNLHLIALAEPYIRIVGFSYIFNALSSIYVGMQRSIENPKFGMIVFAVSTVCNTLGNYLLIFGHFGFPRLGVDGAAIATVISRYVEAGIIIVKSGRFPFFRGLYRTLLIPFPLFRRIFRAAIPLMLNETFWSLAMSALVQCYSTRGINAVAGYNIANTIIQVANSAFLAIGSSIGIIIGNLLGAGKGEEAVSTDRKLIVFSISLQRFVYLWKLFF